MASTRIVQLRPYQQQAIIDLRMAYRNGARAPLLVAPTGMGKTVIFAAITQAAADRGRQVLILVHRRELIHQASTKLAAIGVDHGVIAAGILLQTHQCRSHRCKRSSVAFSTPPSLI